MMILLHVQKKGRIIKNDEWQQKKASTTAPASKAAYPPYNPRSANWKISQIGCTQRLSL
jgi:hypothetical protein